MLVLAGIGDPGYRARVVAQMARACCFDPAAFATRQKIFADAS